MGVEREFAEARERERERETLSGKDEARVCSIAAVCARLCL